MDVNGWLGGCKWIGPNPDPFKFIQLNLVNYRGMNARIRLSVCAEGCGECCRKDDIEYMVKIIDVIYTNGTT